MESIAASSTPAASALAGNAAAIFTLLGVLLGGLLSFGASWLLRRRDFEFRTWEKLLDRRINAHDSLLRTALQMRLMASLESFDDAGELRRVPVVMCSREEFEDFFASANTITLAASPWLSTPVVREAHFLQDYLVSLHANLSGVPSDSFREIGAIVRPDFLEMSGRLERAAYAYFEKDVHRLRLRDFGDWHKYPLEETKTRMASTAFTQRWGEIQQIIAAEHG